MKKTILLIIFILIFYLVISNIISNTKIPNESIRIRVLANSNLEDDQKIKKIISSNVMTYLNSKLKNIKTIEDAREKIISSIPSINKIIDKTLEKKGIKESYKVSYGYNYFPLKKFNNEIYEEGLYESLLITVGSGLGDNFWCLLFPPLCMIDAGNDIEYTSIIKEIFNV